MTAPERLSSPAAERNRQPILAVLRRVLPPAGRALEMLHASPPATLPGLMAGAGRHLAARGVLITYGPYELDDEPLAPGNVEFDAWLKSRDPGWGIRRQADVVAHARAAGLRLRERERVAMPANNLMLVFDREGSAP